jgi:hypothetical protein
LYHSVTMYPAVTEGDSIHMVGMIAVASAEELM